MLARLLGNRLLLGAVVGVLGGLAGAVVLLGVLGGGPATSSSAASTKGQPVQAPAKAAPKKTEVSTPFRPSYVIKDRIVNLADPGGRRYLRFTVALEFEPHEDPKKADARGPEAAVHLLVYVPGEEGGHQETTAGKPGDAEKAFNEAIKKFVPAIEDAVIAVLSSKTYTEVATGDGRERVKKEIRDRVQRVVGDEQQVTNIYFTDFVVQ